jgi:hypothetical protein
MIFSRIRLIGAGILLIVATALVWKYTSAVNGLRDAQVTIGQQRAKIGTLNDSVKQWQNRYSSQAESFRRFQAESAKARARLTEIERIFRATDVKTLPQPAAEAFAADAVRRTRGMWEESH